MMAECQTTVHKESCLSGLMKAFSLSNVWQPEYFLPRIEQGDDFEIDKLGQRLEYVDVSSPRDHYAEECQRTKSDVGCRVLERMT